MSIVAEEGVSRPGAHFVQTKEELRKLRFLVPGSDQSVDVSKPRTPRRPPDRIKLGSLSDGRLRVRRPIQVNIQRKRNAVVASWEPAGEFGYGRNTSEALDDLAKTVAELYYELQGRLPDLGPDLRKVWDVLSSHVESRNG
jgi:hypothetical protein